MLCKHRQGATSSPFLVNSMFVHLERVFMGCFVLCVPRVWLRKQWTKTLCKVSSHFYLRVVKILRFSRTGAPPPPPPPPPPHYTRIHPRIQKAVESTCIYMATASLSIRGADLVALSCMMIFLECMILYTDKLHEGYTLPTAFKV